MLNINTALSASSNAFEAALKRFLVFLLAPEGTDYESFTLESPLETYKIIILALTVGLIVASSSMTYKRCVHGKLVRALSASGAVGKNNAKTLGEIGFIPSPVVARSLKTGTLARMIGCVERDAHEEKLRAAMSSGEKHIKLTEYRPRPDTDRFYLREESYISLENLFSDKNSGKLSLVITIALCIVMAALLYWLVPLMMNMI